MARPSRTALYADDPTFLWKVILRILAILLAIVGIGTIAWALSNRITASRSDDVSDYGSSYGEGDFLNFFYLPWTFITLGLSIVWNVTNLAVLFSRNKAIHPGANVGCDLVLWLALAFTGAFLIIGASNYIDYYLYSGSSSYYDSDTNSYSQKPCDGFTSCAAEAQYEHALWHKGVIIYVGAAMSFLVLFFHFALFISACRYTHARKCGAGSKHAKAITVEATEIANKMIAEMTGPNGTFRPRSQQQQRQMEAEPLLEQGQAPQHTTQASEQQQPMASLMGPPYQSQVAAGKAPESPRRQYQAFRAASPVSESEITAARQKELGIVEEGPSGVHPAFRDER